jgi:putative transposase
MGIEAVYPKKRLSVRNEAHKVYPYLLRNLDIARPGQVWCVDISVP